MLNDKEITANVTVKTTMKKPFSAEDSEGNAIQPLPGPPWPILLPSLTPEIDGLLGFLSQETPSLGHWSHWSLTPLFRRQPPGGQLGIIANGP